MSFGVKFGCAIFNWACGGGEEHGGRGRDSCRIKQGGAGRAAFVVGGAGAGDFYGGADVVCGWGGEEWGRVWGISGAGVEFSTAGFDGGAGGGFFGE